MLVSCAKDIGLFKMSVSNCERKVLKNTNKFPSMFVRLDGLETIEKKNTGRMSTQWSCNALKAMLHKSLWTGGPVSRLGHLGGRTGWSCNEDSSVSRPGGLGSRTQWSCNVGRMVL